MIEDDIEIWIDCINIYYADERQSCSKFIESFSGFFPSSALEQSYFVVTENIPKPELASLRDNGLDAFLDMQLNGITYKNTYYILPSKAQDLSLHFHELVHVLQWKHLGPKNFIARYMKEIKEFGYLDSPLEKMAFSLDRHYSRGGVVLDINHYVSQHLTTY